MINLIMVLQLATIIRSRGNVYVLGEAYAFGVIWSFAFQALAMVVRRFQKEIAARVEGSLQYQSGRQRDAARAWRDRNAACCSR
jgi:hypothetical protein